MRILILLDNKSKSKQGRVVKALGKIAEDYKGVTDVTVEIEYNNFDDLKWINYDDDALGIDWARLKSDAQKTWDRHQDAFDHMIYVIDPVNWRNGNHKIGGWHLNVFYHNYSVEIVKLSHSDEWLYKIFAMEIAHAHDDLNFRQFGVSLDKVFNLDYDYDIVHGLNSMWGVKKADGTFFTDFNYTKLIRTFKPYISSVYKARKKKFDDRVAKLVTRISLLTQIRDLYRQVIMLMNKQPKPVLESELGSTLPHSD